MLYSCDPHNFVHKPAFPKRLSCFHSKVHPCTCPGFLIFFQSRRKRLEASRGGCTFNNMADTSVAENLQQICSGSDLLSHLKLLICDSLKTVEGLDHSRIGLLSLKFNKKLSSGDLIVPAFVRTCFGGLTCSKEDVSLSLSIVYHLTPDSGNELLSFANEKYEQIHKEII